MKHKVYLKDWYFNAGMIGFLWIFFEGELLTEQAGINFGPNYIEFEDTVLDGFEVKLIQQLFLMVFDLQPYVNRLNFILKEILENEKKHKKQKKLSTYWSGKLNTKFFETMSIDFSRIDDLDQFKQTLTNGLALLEQYQTNLQFYRTLDKSSNGREFIRYFLSVKMKGIFDHTKSGQYIKEITAFDYGKKFNDKDICLFCQQRKVKFDYNNSISNISGFNNDNSNWVWGYKSSHIKLCGICALIYSCAFLGLAYVAKMVDGEYRNYLYFINHNSTVKNMYEEIKIFKNLMQEEGNRSKPFYLAVREIVKVILSRQTQLISENINFLEIVDNPILGGQSTKGYNCFNYNIDKNIANFLSQKIRQDRIPRGYYKVNKTFINIDEELLQLTILNQLNYSRLNQYLYYYQSKTVKTVYHMGSVTRYIFDYLNDDKKGGRMDYEMIYNKAFRNGINLRNKIIEKKKENQINGLVFTFLNTLKIADKEKFLDKYIRLMMAYNIPSWFGKDEMNNQDCFLQFGYSFINGLLAQEKKQSNEEGESNEA